MLPLLYLLLPPLLRWLLWLLLRNLLLPLLLRRRRRLLRLQPADVLQRGDGGDRGRGRLCRKISAFKT